MWKPGELSANSPSPATRFEGRLKADSVDKVGDRDAAGFFQLRLHGFRVVLDGKLPVMPLLSCCSGHCGPELGKFPQVLSCCGEEEFVIGTKRAAQAQSAQPQIRLRCANSISTFFRSLHDVR